ncbi:hydroxyisourate hydrolase [Chitinophaga rhizophila]|uniref:5-hydroxyisourate hydrolase n=1 Tax=Chitinophaga rhizophila TaxID=2866212 RepID=A0ABS7GFK9_9BACT|nr:hydroxyisourate hydrolase [Chitinophaga rhizophila]MBW8685288.1 hydroxyisourate hydrolase [Chitinophaga rhizophila]
MSQITTHILDTSAGIPARGVAVQLFRQEGQHWTAIAAGQTNQEGRITDLLPAHKLLTAGIYKLKFETQPYFDSRATVAFYPFVEVVFHISSDAHYHVPLLLNPFGYSTYRGA